MAVKFVWCFRTAALGPSPSAANISLYRCTRIRYVRSSSFRPHNLHGSIVMGDGVFPLLPCKSLYFGGFQKIIEFRRTASRTSGMLPPTPAARMKSSTPSALKHGSDLFETRIHQTHVFRQLLHEQIERLVSGIQFYRRFDIPLHGVWLAVVANSSERLVRDRTVDSCD